MKKVIIEFSETEDSMIDERDLHLTINARKMMMAIGDIHERIFRPIRKHGYGSSKLNDLTEACGEDSEGYSNAESLVHELEKEFHEILSEYNIDLHD